MNERFPIEFLRRLSGKWNRSALHCKNEWMNKDLSVAFDSQKAFPHTHTHKLKNMCNISVSHCAFVMLRAIIVITVRLAYYRRWNSLFPAWWLTHTHCLFVRLRLWQHHKTEVTSLSFLFEVRLYKKTALPATSVPSNTITRLFAASLLMLFFYSICSLNYIKKKSSNKKQQMWLTEQAESPSCH